MSEAGHDTTARRILERQPVATLGVICRSGWRRRRVRARLCLSSPGFAVPALHVLCVCAQVGAGLEETVIEVEVQMMGLDVVQDEHGRHGAWEFAEGVEDVLRL